MVKEHAISNSARALLQAAAARTDGLALPPDHLPIAAQRSVVMSLLKAGLIEEVPSEDGQPAWRTDDTGDRYALRATQAGLAAVGTSRAAEGASSPASEGADATSEVTQEATAVAAPLTTAHDFPPAPTEPLRRPTLWAAAQALLDAWDATANGPPWLAPHFDVLRAAVTTNVAKSGPRQPRTDTKRAVVLDLLRRPEGATVAQVAEATGWTRHTVHGFFAGLKKAGTTIEVLERVRQVGPGKQGAAGSYTIYRAAGAR